MSLHPLNKKMILVILSSFTIPLLHGSFLFSSSSSEDFPFFARKDREDVCDVMEHASSSSARPSNLRSMFKSHGADDDDEDDDDEDPFPLAKFMPKDIRGIVHKKHKSASDWVNSVKQKDKDGFWFFDDDEIKEFYHGTTAKNAKTILDTQHFERSPEDVSMLGEGFYVSVDMNKAKKHSNGEVVLKLRVKTGKTLLIDRKPHPIQKTWYERGYDSAKYVGGTWEETCLRNPNSQIHSFQVCLGGHLLVSKDEEGKEKDEREARQMGTEFSEDDEKFESRSWTQDDFHAPWLDSEQVEDRRMGMVSSEEEFESQYTFPRGGVGESFSRDDSSEYGQD